MTTKLESKFQADLIKDIKSKFPGCVVLKNDPNYIQGIPDLLILHNDKWAMLECKRKQDSKLRPNQNHYISELSKMSFARIIFPDNKEEVLNDLQQAFGSKRATRSTRSK